MTLATRCTSCGTTFKVVQDQLKVSGGWVRCGRCNEVFNAIDGLFEFRSAGGTVPASLVEDEAGDAPQPGTTTESVAVGAADVAAPSSPAQAIAAESPVVEQASPADTVEPAVPTPVPPTPAATTLPTLASFGAPIVSPPLPDSADAADAAYAPAASAAPVRATEQAPAFVRKADRAARWRRPGVRRSLAAGAFVLSLALAWQVTLAYRDVAAARWPAALPLLTRVCAWTGCKVEPLRRIGGLSVDASGLHQIPGTQIYRLSIVLRNRSDLELMLPSFDLTLTDARGDVVVRRALTAAELGSDARTIRSGAELSLEASLNPGDQAISGYTIETFYP